ncbi:MAG: glycosyltransferase [Clostridia bacterium]|nr:glycosyltransferase [Clostridia bacterium]
MKVLQVLWSTGTSSGVSNVVMNYYRNINKDKVQFDFLVLSLPNNSFNNEINELGGMVYKFTVPGIKTYFKTLKDLKEFFKEHGREYDIIHCHELLVAKMVYKYARKYGNVKCISHSHNTKLSEKPLRAIRNRILVSGLAPKSDYCFACSKEAGQNAFGKKIINDKKYKTIYNAINLNNYVYNSEGRKKIREELGLQDKFVLGNVGRLCSQKNQKFAVDVLKELLKIRQDVRLLFVGYGKEESGVLDYVNTSGLLEYVIFTDNRKDVGDLLSAMDCFVFPSLFEGLPVALIEAQSNGLQTIYFDSLTKEVAILDSVRIMANDSTPKDWSDTVVALDGVSENERRGCFEKIKQAGFDIVEQAKRLEDIYYNIKSL